MARNTIQDNKKKEYRRECEKCRKEFDENDLDIVDGDWMCRECEDNLRSGR